MDDSDQDFVDLCSKLLKRNRKKTVDQRQQKKATEQHSSQVTVEEKRSKKNKKDDNTGPQITTTVSGTQSVCTGAAPGPSTDSGTRVKDKVLRKMQQFKRASPQRMVFSNKSQPTETENHTEFQQESQRAEIHPEPLDNDEALAMRLQQELDREGHPVELEDEGLFFCQLCNKDLSHMTPEGRTQHINRCLDEREDNTAPPQLPGFLECPICGKRFKSLKSRSSHLKRCSSDMGVPPAVLLQALQRQAEETHSNMTNTQTGDNKRKGSKSNMPASKKPRKKVEELDEDMMVAMALSSSLLEQERVKQKETEAERAIIETIASNTSKSPSLKWRPHAGKGIGKKKKGGMPRSPPLLLIQDAGAALARIQARASALLLRSSAPSPVTPTRCPSSLPGWTGSAPLWQKSALPIDRVSSVTDFYTPELKEFIVPWESTTTIVHSFATGDTPDSTMQLVKIGTPVITFRASIFPSSLQTAFSSPAVCAPGTGQLQGCSQALQDLMELAEDGMTLTQYGYPATDLSKGQQSSTNQAPNLHLSGFVREEEEENNHGMSRFLPETLDNMQKHQTRSTVCKGEEKEGKPHQSLSLSRLALDLGSMVNNPQLSDLQLQVDSGEVFFAHSFMVYTRCPLLAEMIHESGFGVQEEGVPAAQRVLLNDVPGQAVFALLQYLYTGHNSFPSSLQPYILELASRFDLKDLQEFCHVQEETLLQRDDTDQDQHPNNQADQAFLELLRSMWNDEDVDVEEGADNNVGLDNSKEMDEQQDDLLLGDREIHEEQMNEEELVEIYEFAATQKNRENEDDSVEEEQHVDNQELPEVFPKLAESFDNPQKKDERDADTSLDRSYNRLFSQSWGEYEEKELSALPLDPEDKHTYRSQQCQATRLLSHEMSGRMLLQSSASVIDNVSPSPSPNAPNLPVPGHSPGLSPGLSPGQVGHCAGDEGTVEVLNMYECRNESVKRQSQGTRAICIAISPHSSPKSNEPELVVLSDSSDDMNIDLTQSSGSPSPQNMQSFTNIKVPESHYPNRDKNNGQLPASCAQQPHSDSELSLADCSAEVSWLIPSTPVQPRRSVRTSSAQTKSSICRTQLFPKGDSSPSHLNSPQRPAKDSTHKSSSVNSFAKSAPSMSSSDRSDRSSFDLTNNKKLDCSGFAIPQNPAKYCEFSNQSRSHLNCSKHDTCLPVPAYSSTPVQTEFPKPHTLPLASPFNAENLVSTQKDAERTLGPSPEMAEVQSFHLSPLSERSSASHNKTNSMPYNKSKLSEECSRDSSIVNDMASLETNEPHKDEEEGGEGSFRQSFMDEPPIAFNDSWGLDACAENACFSLRLEDSGGSVQQKNSPEKIKTTTHPSMYPDKQCDAVTNNFPTTSPNRKSSLSTRTHAITSPAHSPPVTSPAQDINNSLLDSKIWDVWEEKEEEEDVAPALSERLKTPFQHKTPISKFKTRQALVPITPMPHYSDMDTPDLKNKLNKFGVRPLPKRQMILKLKEIHQYTHQLVSSDSEDEVPSLGRTTEAKPSVSSSAVVRPVSCAHAAKFKQPTAKAGTSPIKLLQDQEPEALFASQGSNTSSTAASEESERSNPEIVQLSDGDSDSDSGISASQAATRLQDQLQAVRAFILSDSTLYNQILQYQPLVLSQFQQQLKAAGIRLGVTKLADYLDSQCITFTTAKPDQSAPRRRQIKKKKVISESGVRRKKATATIH